MKGILLGLALGCRSPDAMPGDTDADGDADSDSGADSDTDSDADPGADSDTDADPDSGSSGDTIDTGPPACVFDADLAGSTGIVVSGDTCADGAETWTDPLPCGPGTRIRGHRWVAPATGSWRFSTAGSTFDTLLEVRSPCAAGLACDDDVGWAPAPRTSRIDLPLDAAQEVEVRVAGYAGSCGLWFLTIEPTPAPGAEVAPPAVPDGLWVGTLTWEQTGVSPRTCQGSLTFGVLPGQSDVLGSGVMTCDIGGPVALAFSAERTPGGLKGELAGEPITCALIGGSLECSFFRTFNEILSGTGSISGGMSATVP